MRARPRRGRRSAIGGLVLVAGLLLLPGCASLSAGAPSPGSRGLEAGPEAVNEADGPRLDQPDGPADVGLPVEASAVLRGLRTKGRAPMTGYLREAFGPAWLDADRNGCDTRNDVLTRDLTRRVYRDGTHGCVVEAGVLADPYTGQDVRFRRGIGDLVDVDHVVSLGNAWTTGASGWDLGRRAAFANDPMNLLAVDAGANRQKGDADSATWLPPAHRYRCAYVARQVSVKAKYGLWITTPERAATGRVLSRCPGQPLARDSGAPLLAPVAVGASSTTASATTATGSDSALERTGFATCAAARAAGAAPVRSGDPGYGPHLDRDGDGSGCE